MGDRIIEATMKQGLPGWMGEEVAFCLRSIKNPCFLERKKRQGRNCPVRNEERARCCSSFRMLKYDVRSTMVILEEKKRTEVDRVKPKIDTPLSRNQEIYRTGNRYLTFSTSSSSSFSFL